MNTTTSRDYTKGIIILVLVTSLFAVYFYLKSTTEMPGDSNVKTGNYRLEDSLYDGAVAEFKLALEEDPKHVQAYIGLGTAYMQLNRYDLSIENFNRAIELAPETGASYANRGILRDRMGMYVLALADYKKALELDPELAEGPGFLWRFLRNVDKKPPTIFHRAVYLEKELKKPENERLLKVPKIDDKQRMYKYKR